MDDEFVVPEHLVAAAIRVAEQHGKDVADVPMAAIADEAGISRSTLVRRLRGSRRALDQAVRAAGVNPGGRPPVRERAVEAAAQLISEQGLATVTLEEIADAADCSVHSLFAVFGTRDGLFGAVYERYSPLHDLMNLFTEPGVGLEQTVAGIYRQLAASLTRDPQVAPVMLADLFGNPHGPTARIFAQYFPRAMSTVSGWLDAQVRAGLVRDLPRELLFTQLVGPLVAYLLLQSTHVREPGSDFPALEQVCAEFAAAFVRAVRTPVPSRGTATDGRTYPIDE